MTRPGDAAPDRSQPDWIVRLHRDTTAISVPPASPDGDALLAGPVVARRGRVAEGFGALSMLRRPSGTPLTLTRDVMDLRCAPRDLPDARSAEPTTDLDHVVHILCSRFDDPQAIEDFLDATHGLIDEFFAGREGFIGREAWFEVLAHATDSVGGTSEHPLVDDVYVARYPTADAWLELHEWGPWKHAVEALEAEATTMFHLIVQPTVNRLAAHR